VTGRLTALHFEEGQAVKEGDLLVTIDPRPFEVALAQAQADWAEAVSGSENARDQARRYTELNRTGGASREQIEQYVTAARQAEAQAESAQAAVRKAELELAYCSIRAAISGRTGRHVVTPGNVVTANQTELVVIHQLAPIDVVLAVPERHLPALQTGMAAGSVAAKAVIDGPEPRRVEGALRFLDNAVRPGTGTIDLKAAFPNEPSVLWPGQFVTVVLEVAVQRDVVVVPASAPQPGQQGTFVFVVGEDQTVSVRAVKVDRTQDDQAVITDGLKGGERVVTDGQSRLAAGARVVVKESLEAAAAAAISTRP
jgi:multidrug efflux system membrane fusion protein